MNEERDVATGAAPSRAAAFHFFLVAQDPLCAQSAPPPNLPLHSLLARTASTAGSAILQYRPLVHHHLHAPRPSIYVLPSAPAARLGATSVQRRKGCDTSRPEMLAPAPRKSLPPARAWLRLCTLFLPAALTPSEHSHPSRPNLRLHTSTSRRHGRKREISTCALGVVMAG
ncbi:hypothetical protein DFH08DRAFT_156255 [Mycena albidolilacea]|uniref:Uncharacterized protein n=1 Tax=Mycena albidolilacea TaxID=1033008 RepID=A0AAD7A288_9AGAR|nr:hypothetical protein DFH08DRAFT_156255 [Mycena albidolilacea]